MGKPIAKNKKKSTGSKGDDAGGKHARGGEHQHPGPSDFDADDNVFIEMSRELKEEGSKLFQRRDYRGAVTTYEKAVKLLPRGHADIASLRSYLATCYMHMEPADYHHAIEQCNMALEVSPKYSKALLKRARCYEALDRLDFAAGDVDLVLRREPNSVTAMELSHRVRKELESRRIKLGGRSAIPVPEPVMVNEREKPRKKKSHKAEDKAVVKVENLSDDVKLGISEQGGVADPEQRRPPSLRMGRMAVVVADWEGRSSIAEGLATPSLRLQIPFSLFGST